MQISVLKPLSDMDTTQGVKEEGKPSIVPYQEHIACSFAYKIVSSVVPDFNKPIVWYRCEDAVDEFVSVLSVKQKNCVPTILKHHKKWSSVKMTKCILNVHNCVTYASKLL